MFPFQAGWRDSLPTGAKQKQGSSNREFPSLRFSEPEIFHPATGVSLMSGQCQVHNCMEEKHIRSLIFEINL